MFDMTEVAIKGFAAAPGKVTWTPNPIHCTAPTMLYTVMLYSAMLYTVMLYSEMLYTTQ